MTEILALIPARGSSKSIPRKNLIPILGRPLIAYTVAQARASRHITRAIVSTDDAEIARVARECGAEVPFMRPAEFAQDLSPDIDVFYHALSWLRDEEGYEPELVVHLRPTGPVRRVDAIDEAIALLLAHPDADSVRAVSAAIQSPYKMWRVDAGHLFPLLQVEGMVEAYNMPRQMLPQVYWQNGYVDVVRPHVVLERHMMCGDRILPFITHEPVLEIDYAESIPLVEQALLKIERGEPLIDEHEAKRYPV